MMETDLEKQSNINLKLKNRAAASFRELTPRYPRFKQFFMLHDDIPGPDSKQEFPSTVEYTEAMAKAIVDLKEKYHRYCTDKEGEMKR